jgi:hypothetical protein
MLLVLLLALSVPAYAKHKQKKPPIPCSDLWTAVSETLGNTDNYRIVAIDNEHKKANFTVVGALFPKMGLVWLKPGKSGCELRLKIGFTGADEDFALRTRVNRVLKKLEADKASSSSDTGSRGAT